MPNLTVLPVCLNVNRNDPVGVRACKQLLLENLACPQLPGSKLSDAWVPACRVRSSLMQALN